MTEAEPVVVTQHPAVISVHSRNARRWTVLLTPKLARLVARLVARSYSANIHVGAHERPFNTYGFDEAATAIDLHVRDDVRYKLIFDRWLALHNRNLQAQPGRRYAEGPGPVRNL
jgi:hypothetical protein